MVLYTLDIMDFRHNRRLDVTDIFPRPDLQLL